MFFRLDVRLLGWIAIITLSGVVVVTAQPTTPPLFGRKNLVAWCIVPFDSKKRGPEERAAMLERLGFSRFAYDYRAEHIPTFDAEIEALKRHGIELTAWWFPASLNDEAKMTLAVFSKHKVTPQLWVTGGGGPTKDEADQKARVVAEAARIRPIAEAAAAVGCKVALYNHGGWFGEPENQIAIIKELKLDNVGIVYNQHHGHDHIDRFPELLKLMKPYLLALNLNGMVKEGDRKNQKILQLGQGDLDLKLLTIIRDSGYSGPIGILGHTDDDAEQRLHDNLDGLDWLLPQLGGKPAGPKPTPRTPVPRAVAAAVPAPAPATDRPLVEGRFGQALDGRSGGAFVAGRDEFRQFPITIECWTRLSNSGPYNILLAHEQKSSGTHWEIFSMAGTGRLTAYLPGFAPDHCHSNATICDNKWHYVAMILEPKRVRLFLDGKPIADQQHKRTDRATEAGGLAIASLVDKAIGCTGLVDEVRISKGIRAIDSVPEKPFTADSTTIALWHLDELQDQKRLNDASPLKNAALLGGIANPSPAKDVAKSNKIEGHWGEDAIGFRWTEADSRDDRFGQMDTGPFFSGSITGPGGPVYKGIVVRVGDKREASLCYDTELLRVSAGWTGFLKFDAARLGIIVPPKVDGDAAFTTPRFPGWSRTEQFENFREANPFGPLPKQVAHYEGLYRQGQRVVLKYVVGTGDGTCTVLESPWLETSNDASALTRTLQISPAKVPLRMMVAESKAFAHVMGPAGSASLVDQPGVGRVLSIPAHDKPISIKLLLASAGTDRGAFDKIIAASPQPVDPGTMTQLGSTIWGEPLVTRGELGANAKDPYVVDTITLPFENRFKALFFCGGHDFLPDGRAAVCTLHGDVWIADGIDSQLDRITWRRFATGLFQPLGIRYQPASSRQAKTGSGIDSLYVVGRDQITRLHDTNNDGEADFYENFNNDAHVTLNGHEYVTCLETDRAGNFYYVKGNCNSQTPHDGCLLRVSADGSKLDVHATGFRNPNGMGMGPHDEITVAPQEGEWTPASGVFLVEQGGFYGGMMSHHRPTPPTDFERPLVWFPRLADNSSGGQVWTTSDRWGPLSNHLLHLSYGQCRLRLILQDKAGLRNGCSIELPLRFNSGIHRGRMNPNDGQLYLTGLKGWTTSGVHDGCFQRVRYTGQPVDYPVELTTHKNGIALTFARELDRQAAEDLSSYQLEAWNYKWSAAYGSPEFRPSAAGQTGRDSIEPRSATLRSDNRTVFLELSDLKPVDQLAINYSLLARDGTPIEQSAILTLNSLSTDVVPERELHRPTADPERAELLARLRPGVVVEQMWGRNEKHRTERHVLRLVAWNPEEGSELASDSLAGIVITGWIDVPQTGLYRFSVNGASANRIAKITFPKDSKSPPEKWGSLIDGAEFSLRRGLNHFRIIVTKYEQFRLMWESHRFPREAVPSSRLQHEDIVAPNNSELITAFQFENLRCLNCHQEAKAVHEVSRQPDFSNRDFFTAIKPAPRLDGIAARLNAEWIKAWIRNPRVIRHDAHMPSVLNQDEASTANDIVAYLQSLPGSNDNKEVLQAADSLAEGEDLFERLACIACHSFVKPGGVDSWSRVSLHFAKAKYRPAALVNYLMTPHAHHTNSRMPDFHLQDSEAVSLAQYILRESKGELAEPASKQPGNIERGRNAFTSKRCANCHMTEPDGRLANPDVKPIRDFKDFKMTCVATSPETDAGLARFRATPEERESLVRYATQKGTEEESNRPIGSRRSVTQWMRELRCFACHSRDKVQSQWPEIVTEEGSGRIVENVPALTFVGEKLQGAWVEKFIRGDIKQKPRPWITARMPSFPAYASLLAHGMAAEHGVAFEESLPDPDADRIEIGRQLTMRDGGLDCRQCHGVGKELPRGDKSTQIALGINFTMTKDRLRPEFALRQLLDPPRYDAASRMPRFAPDLKTTAAKQIEGGDAIKQFEALKQFLWSVEDK